MAWRKLDMPYAMPGRPIDALPGVMCQHDFDGKRLFQHRNMRKWSFYNNPCTPGFLHEDQCVTLVNELKYIWSPASQELATADDLEAMSLLDRKSTRPEFRSLIMQPWERIFWANISMAMKS